MIQFAGVTLADYAKAKGFDIDRLREFGLHEVRHCGVSAIEMPYRDRTGMEVARRYRMALEGDRRFLWRKGDHACLYGLDRIDQPADWGSVHLVEGESDCHALWLAGYFALGVPGVSTWVDDWAEHFASFDEVHAWIEPDSAGANLEARLRSSPLAPKLRLVRPGRAEPMKDASALFLDEPGKFRERVQALMAEAEIPSSDLGSVLDEVDAFLRRYVAFPSEFEPVAVALWVIHCYLLDQVETSPYLSVTSPVKQCGKTTLLDVLEMLVPRPWRAITPSDAVVYRWIAKNSPTFMLDEADVLFGVHTAKNYEGLRGLLNAGNRRGSKVPRVKDKSGAIEEFEVFCAKVIAAIGDLPDTIADRSIAICLTRRKASERLTKFRRRRVTPDGQALKERIESGVHGVVLAEDPDVPDCLGDRAADGWEPLLAIADVAGGDWPSRARAAAVTLSGHRDPDADSLSIRLLSELRTIFGDSREPRASTSLVADLKANADAPWATVGRDGISANMLANLLRPYKVRSVNVRIAGAVVKGYKRDALDDVFDRFLPPVSAPDIGATGATAATEEGLL